MCLAGTAVVLREGGEGFESGKCRLQKAAKAVFGVKKKRVEFSFQAGVSPVHEFWKFRKFRRVRVPSRAYTQGTCRHRAGGRRMEAAAGGGGRRRQELASASGGTSGQSDQRRGASGTGTVPTARVHHKEPMGSSCNGYSIFFCEMPR